MITKSEALLTRPDGSDLFKLRAWYRKVYLKTLHWDERRLAALEASGYQCEGCDSGGSVQIHHLQYHNLFEEPPEDLMALCGPCHKLAHNEDTEKILRGKSVEEKRKIIKKTCQKSQTPPVIKFGITGLSNRWKK